MKHYIRYNIYTDASRYKLKTVRKREQKHEKLQKVDVNSILPSIPVSLTICIDRLLFFNTSTQKEIRKEIIIVNIEDDCHVFSNPLPIRYKILLCVLCLSC